MSTITYLYLTHIYLAPLLEFRRDVWYQKKRILCAIILRFMRDCMFSSFGTVLVCDGHWTDRHTMTAYNEPA